MEDQIEKQAIEEKAKIICRGKDCRVCVHSFELRECGAKEYAKRLYNAGYLKQSVGEWVANRHISVSKRNRTIHYETYKCSVCGTWNGRHRQNFCPNCGAKMKGGAG